MGPEGRKKVVCKQGDLVWKSVPTNLVRSTAWFVEEMGLSWDEMRKVCLCLCLCSVLCALCSVLWVVLGFCRWLNLALICF